MIDINLSELFKDLTLPPDITDRQLLCIWIEELNRKHNNVRKGVFAEVGKLKKEIALLANKKKKKKRVKDEDKYQPSLF